MKNRFGVDWDGITGTFFWKQPELSRRLFFRHLGSAIGGYFLLPTRPMETIAKAAASPIGKARNVIFVLMAGGPSHVDTFDFKQGSWVPALMEPESYGDVLWPRGLMPKLAEHIDSIALLRSVRSWAAVHELAADRRRSRVSLSRQVDHDRPRWRLDDGGSPRAGVEAHQR